jgi:GNAT superfamily N-acetyltransferase
MAVEPAERGHGCGNVLIEHAIAKARVLGASSMFLFSNAVLESAIALYRKHCFTTTSYGCHPVHARCNIVMERQL